MKSTGTISGDTYNVNEVQNFKVNTNDLGGVFHIVILTNINHLGKDSNAVVTIERQTVLDDEGLTKTVVSHYDIRCPNS